jgi:para-nitrobenzyl esterase
VPVQELLTQAQLFQPYAFGNNVLPEVPAQALREGRFQRVPVMSGGTRDEHRLMVGLFRDLADQPVTVEQYSQLLAAAFGEYAGRVQERYPLTDFESQGVAWASALTDRMWARSTFEQHRLLAAHVPVYAYEFADRAAPMYLPFPQNLPPGAFHAAEIPYVFNDEKFTATGTEDQHRLSSQMIRYWANFARSGDPNEAGLPPWRPFNPHDPIPYVQSLAPGNNDIGAVDYAAEHNLDFWINLREGIS